MFTEGPAKYYVMVQPREYWKYPGLCNYKECISGQQKPIYLEVITMQEYVHQSFQRCGQLWERNNILLKIAEELGELVQSFRKSDRNSQLHEYGDILFSLFALAEREQIDVNEQLCNAVVRFEQYCNQPAKNSSEQIHSSPVHEDYSDNLYPLTKSYNQRCSACQQPIHKTNTVGLCANCYATRRALAGNMAASTDGDIHAEG